MREHIQRWATVFASVVILCLTTYPVQAANYPCSGSKGGVAHCAGEHFVCNDGSISGSKKICIGPQGGSAARGLLVSPRPAAGTECACRSGNICTGPRGGQYCLTDIGNKSYVRR
jgi:hypothetical protein